MSTSDYELPTPEVAVLAGSAAPAESGRKVKVSAILARLLAEAAAGHPGKTIWFTALLKPNEKKEFDISDPIESEEEPDVDIGMERGLFGPYFTDLEPNGHTRKLVKFTVSSEKLDGTGAKDEPFLAKDVDLLVGSLAALDKFVLPYYARIAGVEFALKLRQDFLKANTSLFRHLPGSEPSLGVSEEKLRKSFAIGL
jgi:hypothetical protein